VLVLVEEHNGHGIVQLVHGVEVLDLVEVDEVDDGEVLDLVGDAVQHLRASAGTSEGRDGGGITSSCRMQSESESRPKRRTTSRSSSLRMAWSTCQPVRRCGRTTEPMSERGCGGLGSAMEMFEEDFSSRMSDQAEMPSSRLCDMLNGT
jgi:hypothetical protein